MNLILYVCCMLSGMFLGVMFFTIIENSSKSFRQFVRKFCRKVDLIYRRIIMWSMIFIMGYAGYAFMPLGLTFNGLIAGDLSQALLRVSSYTSKQVLPWVIRDTEAIRMPKAEKGEREREKKKLTLIKTTRQKPYPRERTAEIKRRANRRSLQLTEEKREVR